MLTEPSRPTKSTKSTNANSDSFPALYANTGRFSAGKPRTIRAVSNGSRVLFCRARSKENSLLCLWVVDLKPATGSDGPVERLLVDPSAVLNSTHSGSTSEDEEIMSQAEKKHRERSREGGSGIVSYDVDADGTTACFVLQGALYIVDIASGSTQKLSTATPVFGPKLRPDGSQIAYVHDQTLRLVDLPQRAPQSPAAAQTSNSQDRLLLSDPSPTVFFGRADFIAAEEIGRSNGFWWSPDSSQLLTTKVDEQSVTQWWLSEPGHPDRPPQPVRYPAAGTTNSTTELLLVETTSPGQVDSSSPHVDTCELLSFEYLVNVVWAADHHPVVLQQTRDQKTVAINDLHLDDLTLHARQNMTDNAWVDVGPGLIQWCDAGLLTVENCTASDSDSTSDSAALFKALCVNGKAVTGSDIHVKSLAGVVGDIAVITAWKTPTQIDVVAVDISTGLTTTLTSQTGVHTAAVGATTIVITSANSATPGTATAIHQLTSHSDNKNPASPPTLELTEIGTITSHHDTAPFVLRPQFNSFGVDDISTVAFFPENHDGTTPLPVLLDPYGGPHAQRVLDYHDGHLVSQWFANQGFAVLVADGRGTPGRGPTWEHRVWGDLAQPVLEDQLQMLDAAAEKFGCLDLNRVGIRGWSFGGYLAALAVLARPDRFHCAIAGAPVTSWRLYDTHYTERYLGHPETHPDHYDQSDLLLLARQLPADHPKRDLLCIHGLADDNVLAAHTLQLSTALLSSGYPHQVLPLSGVSHMTPQAVVAENLLRLQLDFLHRCLTTDHHTI